MREQEILRQKYREMEEIKEENIYLLVYSHTLSYAKEHAESDAYRASRRLNIACKNAVEEAIKNNFDGMHLANDVVEPILKKYGQERLSYVLACTLQYKTWDKRFSRNNKEWAENIPVEENVNRGVDVNIDYVVDSHPAVLDGFVNLARKRFIELEQTQEQEATFMEDAEKYLDDKELQQLASDIDQFSSEYDLYEYRDSVEDREENVRQIYSDFVFGQADSILKWISAIAAEENDDLPEVVEDAEKLVARIKRAQKIQ